MAKILLRTGVVAVTIGALALLTSTPEAKAAAIVVTSTADNATPDGWCTLREALTNANADAATYADCQAGTGADTISFNVTGTITLLSVLPDVTGNLTISGPGAGSLAISGNNARRVFSIAGGANVELSGLTIRQGQAYADVGGGIFNAGTLTIRTSTVSGNVARVSGAGGGVFNGGTLTVISSTISGNSTTGVGGGIYNNGTARVNNSTISGNSATGSVGGGIYNAGTLTISASTFSGNAVPNAGAGINNMGTLTVSNSTFSGNTADDLGGGIGNYGTLTVSNSTFSGNSARYGGGLYSGSGAVAVTGTLFSGNSASDSGAAIYFSGILNVPRRVSDSCFVNNIDPGTVLDVNNQATASLTVDGNWWNTPTGPNTDGETTNVPVASFLTSQPACGAGAAGGETVDLCVDGRLNCRLGDDYAIVYNAQDDHGHPSLHTYCVDAAGNGVLGMIVTPHDLEGISPKPATNTQVKKGDTKVCRTPISFWALTTGEYQLNIGPDYKGDLIRMIFNGLPPDGKYFKKCNVLTSFGLCSK